MLIIVFRIGVRNTYEWDFPDFAFWLNPNHLPSCGINFPIRLFAKTCRYTDCKMCARLQISFVFLHILARETVGTSPVASLLAFGTSTSFSLVAPNGEVSHSPNPIDQPYAVWMRTSLSLLDNKQKGVPAPLNPASIRETNRPPIGCRHFTETIGAFRSPSGHPR